MAYKTTLAFLWLFFGFLNLSKAQTYGCTDPQARNYNPEATINDGSCEYEAVYVLPGHYIQELPDIVDESSGLLFFRNALWTHNDSGGTPEIFKIDTLSGEIIQTIGLLNTDNTDWEDICQNQDYIFIGDMGNNAGNRQDLCIYKILKSNIPEEGDVWVSTNKIEFSYADQTNFNPPSHGHNFDCEAMVASNDSLYLFTKNWENEKTKIYRLPVAEGEYELYPVDSFNVNGLICGASFDEGIHQLVLCGYQSYTPFIYLVYDFPSHNFFKGNKRRIDFPLLFGTQTEGVTWFRNKHILISNEASVIPQSVFILGTASWTGSPTGTENNNQQIIPAIKINPNPVIDTFTLNIPQSITKPLSIELFNLRMRKQKLGRDTIRPMENRAPSFNVSHLKAGIYLVRLYEGNTVYSLKLIKSE